VAGLAAGCGGAHGAAGRRPAPAAATTGVVTGIADACAGLLSVATAHLEVYRGDVLVARQQVPNGTTYRFVLPPGLYTVTNTGDPKDMGHQVSVAGGHTSALDIADACF
jgi:hypothetical protein